MRIERVVAHAFGPLVEQTLDPAPGMTLIYGPNEAGKSSWHAAIFAGLCGMRRGKGALTIEDREFRDDHKPWDADRWDVELLVRLADGRRIEIRQDLAGKVDSRAVDIGLGTDVSNEIMVDGSPDGSRWLGLDRRAFHATACIDQAQLLAVADDPDSLQQHLQRAAATRGTDATAAAALDRLDAFRKAQVGEDRANSTKPLRRAKLARDAAWQATVEARRRHAAYLDLAGSADAARVEADGAATALRPVVAALAARRATTARSRADRATELAARFPGGAPVGPAERADVDDRVAAALAAWQGRPDPIPLEGADAEALALELGRLPARPIGDLDPALEVVRAKAEYDRRLEARRLVGERPVGERPVADRPAADRPAAWLVLGSVAAVALVVGLIALTLQPVAAVLMLLVGALVAGAAAWVRRTGQAQGGIEPGATEPSTDLDEARVELATRLTEHGTVLAPGDDVGTAFERYLTDCRTRAGLARDAARADAIRVAIDTRSDLERRSAAVDQRNAAAEAGLRAAAAEVGLGGDAEVEPEAVAAALRDWQERRSTERESAEAAILEWRELHTLLAGRGLADLTADADRLEALATEQAGPIDPAHLAGASARLGADPERRIAELESEATRTRAEADRLSGRVLEMAAGLPSVAEAEEALAQADAEADRVTGLDAVLRRTMDILRAAEERVHRDLAPVLGAAITAELPRISGGRYVEAAVNPADLAVRVKAARDGMWRDAKRLSHGTREQIYLLLRLAMTRQLVNDDEVAPLLCDEVTVQSDQRRATAVLDLLHETSQASQVIVFTHDERALAWAEANLTGEDDRLIRLEPELAPV